MLNRQIATALLALVLSAPAAAAEELVVIVNAANPATSLDVKAVRAYFLKTLVSWFDGARVRPVDQSETSPKRAAFLGKVLGMSSTELERYWLQRQYSSTEAPPAKAPDDAEVIRLVKSSKGAIGFVSKDAAAREGVKVVLTLSY